VSRIFRSGWTPEDYARWWILQPECGETSRTYIEALLAVIDTLQQGDSTQPFDDVAAPSTKGTE
jgi:hypothetical protein